MTIYLDNNAAAPIRPVVKAAMTAAMDVTGNPSAIHGGARAARGVVERAREQVGALIHAKPESLTFTASGTEANNLAVNSAVRRAGVKRLIVTGVEHACVAESARHAPIPHEVWPVDANGVVDLDWLADRLKRWTADDGALWVGLTFAQNETGVIQPVRAVADMVHAHGGILHVDAVQAAGKVPVDVVALDVDSLALAGHKLGGPIGNGALYVGPRASIAKLIHGGGQERGMRAGSENIVGLAGFGAAAEAARLGLPNLAAHAAWRDGFEAHLSALAPVTVFGAHVLRLPNTSCVACPGFAGTAQVMALDLDGIHIGSGSACSSGAVKASGILTAMGVADDLARCAIRLSSGWANTEADFTAAADAWATAYARVQARVTA
jgi:cysteine desulfurase